jgi:hypothetical protein
MTLSRHHVVALIGAALTSTIALSDAVMHGVTSRNLIMSDNSGHTGWIVTGDLVHGFTYAALLWVLIRERTRFERANRFTRALRYVLIASLGVLAAGFVLVDPVLQITKVRFISPFGTAWEWMASIGFAGMILSSLLLGIAVLRNNPLGYGGRLLGLLVPVLGVSVLLGFVASDWAHPGYVETIIHFGVAMIGVRAAADRTSKPMHRTDTEPDDRQMVLDMS